MNHLNFEEIRMPLAIRPLVVATAFWVTVAHATPEDALVAFDGTCIATRGRISTIERMANAARATEVPSEVVLQDAAAAKYGGRGFAFFKSTYPFIVIATTKATCSVLVRGESEAELVRLLEASYPLAKPFVETAGPQVVRFYRLINPSTLAGGYLAITIPKPGFKDEPFFSLGFIPAESAATLRRKR